MPPEKSAYSLARYSRSPDSIRDSIEWVRTHDSAKFLESFYYNYGHASIADLGHLTLCFEGISELAAIEIEDEQLWDGQARSSRYQDFSRSGFITPPGAGESYAKAAAELLKAYQRIHKTMSDYLADRLPRPADMKPELYRRNISARAFDIARYTLFLGVPTGVGQVTSIRTLERQIRRLKASEYAEVRQIGEEMATVCAAPPECVWDEASAREALAPTLARHVDPDQHVAQSRADLEQWARENLPPSSKSDGQDLVYLTRPIDTHADVTAQLLFPVTDRSFHQLYDIVSGWSTAQRNEVIDLALRSRGDRDELLRAFRGGPYAFDFLIDIGAYRDLHRHRRCHQFRQAFTGRYGYETPEALAAAGLKNEYESLMDATLAAMNAMEGNAAHYLAPFGARSRFLFKMDFAEAEYIARLRSGVKGHFSYRQIAWQMKEKMQQLEPELGRLMQATPPWVDDPLKR
jgi:thymidylate synthase ThyX